MVLFCDTPLQSVAAALVGGVVGGAAGAALGFGTLGVVLLAGALAGAGDVAAHVVRRDHQFQEAVAQYRAFRNRGSR